MLDNLAQAYHWSHKEMMALTMKQIIMYNHSSRRNYDKMQNRIEGKKKKGSNPEDAEKENDKFVTDNIGKDPIVNGKRLSEMTTDEYMRYYTEGFKF